MERTRTTTGLRAGIAIGTAIALIGIAIGVTVASVPASNGAITGCYKVSSGALRVIDYPAQRCVSGERQVRWNQAGPSNVAAMRSTPCTAGPGTAGALAVTISATNGDVSLQCQTVLSVAGSVTFDRIDFANGIETSPLVKVCGATKACSAAYGLGTPNASVHLLSGSSFGYTCPGGVAKRSIPLDKATQHGECPNVLMTVNRAVVVTP
jgi:hypothetical protein